MTKIFYLFACILILSCSAPNSVSSDAKHLNYFDATDRNRTAAEWEPALGTLVVWPLAIPHTLVIELAKDNHLYLMLEDEVQRAEAEKWLGEWGINSRKVTFIYAAQGVDAWWTRDWGPSAVFTSKGEYSLADGKYIYATPNTDLECNDSLRFQFRDENGNLILTQIDDDANIPLAEQLGYDLIDLPFNNTGGNVLTDGLGSAFSSCVIRTENEFHGVDPDRFFSLNDSLLGFDQYHIISNFELHGIQHVDCFMKVIDEETLLVAQTPKDHELYEVYENIVENELKKLETHYKGLYTIKRIQTAPYHDQELAAYTNSLILNKTVYVPLFQIDEDEQALQTWRNVMPGYEVKGFTYLLDDEPIVEDDVRDHYVEYGWNSGDALHCRTRAIWDPEMLFISVKKIEAQVELGQNAKIYTTIIDYSEMGLVENSPMIKWRLKGSSDWRTQSLISDKDEKNGYYAEIPGRESSGLIEYYIEATSESGAVQRRPMTAPRGFYTFSYIGPE